MGNMDIEGNHCEAVDHTQIENNNTTNTTTCNAEEGKDMRMA